jgi:hypothetical protein
MLPPLSCQLRQTVRLMESGGLAKIFLTFVFLGIEFILITNQTGIQIVDRRQIMSDSSSRLVVKLSILIVCVSLLLVMVTCSTGGGGPVSPSDVANVGTIAPSALVNSGVSSPPTTLSGTFFAVSRIPSSDSLVKDIGSAMADISSQLSGSGSKGAGSSRVIATMLKTFSVFAGIGTKSLASDISTQVAQIGIDIKNFPTAKSLNEKVNFSGDILGQYLKLTTATCEASASVVTTDGAAMDTSSNFPANFKSGTGQVTLSLVVDPQNLPTSAIKDFKLRINAGGTINLGAATVNGAVQPANLSLDYGESAVLALSVNSSGAGGKIVITANAKNTANIKDPTTFGQNGDFSALAPSITVSITVYKDDGTQTYAQTWTDLSALLKDIAQ